VLLSMVGSDIGPARRGCPSTFPFADGLAFATVAMGAFGFAEIIRNLDPGVVDQPVGAAEDFGLMPTKKDSRITPGHSARNGAGIDPRYSSSGGAVIASFAAYTFEKKISKHPQRFGRGAIEGVAAPESANNAAAQTSFIPLLTLGIPPNAVMALMVGAMTIHGIVPGPQVMQKQPELVWGMIASMDRQSDVAGHQPADGGYLGAPVAVPYRLLFPCIVIFCAIGIYSVNNAPMDVVLTAAFGLVGCGW
jgi:putative tricarboxylic transport membrane protein